MTLCFKVVWLHLESFLRLVNVYLTHEFHNHMLFSLTIQVCLFMKSLSFLIVIFY